MKCGAAAFLAALVLAAAASAALPTPDLTLDRDGSGDKTPLRNRYKAGDTIKSTTSLETLLIFGSNGASEAETPFPLVELRFETTVDSVNDTSVVLETRLADVTVSGRSGAPDELVTALKDDFETLEGLEVTVTQTHRGLVTEARFERPSRLGEAAGAVVDDLEANVVLSSTIYPEEPVGEGAEWTVKVTTETDGRKTDNTVQFKLVKRSADELELEVRATSTGDAPPFELPGLPEGAKIEPRGAKGEGESKNTIRLDKPSTATAGKNVSTCDYRLELPDGSSKDFTVTYKTEEKTTID